MTAKQEQQTKQSPRIKCPRPEVIVKYVCIECGTMFESFDLLRQHAFNNHYCRICEIFFHKETLLQRHMQMHSYRSPCPYCPSKPMFQDGDNLTSHIVAHHPERRMDICCSHRSCSFKGTGLTHILMDHFFGHLVEEAEDYVWDERWPITDDPVEFWVGINENKSRCFPLYIHLHNVPKFKLWMEQPTEEVVARLEWYKAHRENIKRQREEQEAKELKEEQIRAKRQQEAEQRYWANKNQFANESFDLQEEDFNNFTKPFHRGCPCYACTS